MADYTIRELHAEDIQPGLLGDFNRHQEVYRCWRNVEGEWVLRDVRFTEDWDETVKQDHIDKYFPGTLASGGALWGAFTGDGALIGFAALWGKPLGSRGQYRQLMQLHVSREHRGKGLGRRLLRAAGGKAREMGAEKLYISGHSAEETQAFYARLGCVDAQEVDAEAAAREPFDRQLEYIL